MEILGCLITIGDGHHSIMGVGYTEVTEDGPGYLDTNGDQPGLTGEAVAVITGGRR